MECLETDHVKALWEVSLKEEKEVVPDWFERNGGEAELMAAFEKFHESGALCCLNVTAILVDETVRKFLTSEQ
jgi:hypothetical protein